MIRMAKTMIIVIANMIPNVVMAANVVDLLIMQDVGQYKFMGKGGGLGPGIVGSAAHFSNDHADESYGALYFNDSLEVGVKVEVSQHSGVDSDKWLMHEVEDSYRDERKLNGAVATNVQIRTIDGRNVYFLGIYGGKSYTWLASNNIVVDIDCSSCSNMKPEPLDIVKAYLAKHPSVISITDVELKSKAHSEIWIKDEMQRRLWLGDKWFAQIQLSDPKLRDKLKSMTDSMVVFLNYREKYYGIASKNDKIALETALFKDNVSVVQAKLQEYKAWWAANKGGAITLP